MKTYTPEFINTVLTYARDYTMAVAAKKFKVSIYTIRSWNKKLKIVPVKTYRHYTQVEKERVLRYAKKHGVTAASREFGIAERVIYVWNKQAKIYPIRPRRAHSRQKRQAAVQYSNKYGRRATAEKYNVAPTLVTQWREKSDQAVPQNILRNQQEKNIILTYADKHGVVQASQKFNVAESLIRLWNQEMQVYTIQERRKFLPTERINILTQARDLMEKQPDFYPTASVAYAEIHEKYDIHVAQLYAWNRKYMIVPSTNKPHPKAPISEQEVELVRAALIQNAWHVAAASRQTGITKHMIDRMLNENYITKVQ